MKLHRFVLTLGSNSQPQKRLAFVRGELECLCFERLTFSPARESAPVCFGLSDAPFTDIVSVGETHLEQEDFARLLKELECRAGRTPDQRRSSPAEIPVDIDLIVWDRLVLKPQDLSRPYLIQGLEDLGEALLPE